MLIGAGTLLTRVSVDAAVQAGASFGVAPGLSESVVEAALARGLPFVPGVATASEIERGLALGLRLFKLFPAEAVGGRALIDAFAAPYADVRFMPTGGITPQNLEAYLKRPAVAACGGTWIAPRSLLEAGDYDEISMRAAAAVRIATHDSTTGKEDL
jgi:2-dehydro-3-deoxyphosphogluconate aldolase/(4S)-4-hydroxy-2-oxoglutarate aldolase